MPLRKKVELLMQVLAGVPDIDGMKRRMVEDCESTNHMLDTACMQFKRGIEAVDDNDNKIWKVRDSL